MSASEHNRDPLLESLQLDDRAGPARRLSRDQSQAFITQALDTWQREVPRAPRRVGRTSALAAAAALLLMVAGGASAARWYFGKAAQVEHRPRVGARAVERGPHTTLLPPVTVEAEAKAPKARPTAVKPVRKPSGVEKPEKSEPDDLLQRANRLRAEGRFQSAADTYAQVYERYPQSLSAYAARVAAGSIELEHLGKPQHAHMLFESALREHPGGALDLEARQGLALSLRDLGRDQDEARVLKALIRAHSESPAARRAAARLRELAGEPPAP